MAQDEQMLRITYHVPESHLEQTKQALFDAGAGSPGTSTINAAGRCSVRVSSGHWTVAVRTWVRRANLNGYRSIVWRWSAPQVESKRRLLRCGRHIRMKRRPMRCCGLNIDLNIERRMT